MPEEVQRRILFYAVEVPEDETWNRAEVLRGLAALNGDDRYMDVGDETVVYAQVDRVPNTTQAGRLRLFRVRRSNLPAVEDQGALSDLNLPDTAGLAEPSHIVLGPNGVLAAEYNHYAPRVSALARLLRQKLSIDVRIGTYVQGDVLTQLERLDDVRRIELSIKPGPGLAQELRGGGGISDAIAELLENPDGKTVALQLSGDRTSASFTQRAKGFARRIVSSPSAEAQAKIVRVHGRDPATGHVEPVDLIDSKVIRKVQVEREQVRSRALNNASAYHAIEHALAEARNTDLPSAAIAHSR